MLLTPIDDTELVRIDYVFLGSQWLQTHPLQARLTFSQLKEGSVRFRDGKLTELLENYGATLTTQSTLSYSTVTVYCLHRYLNDVLSMVHSMLVEPTYPEDKFSLALSQARTKWQIQHQQVATLCKEAFYRQLYGEQHPMGRFPTLTDYDTLSTQDLRDYYRNYVRPSYMSLMLTGRFDESDQRLVEHSAVTDAEDTPVPFVFPTITPVMSAERERRIDTDTDHVQAAVRLGRLLPPANHPDMPLIRLLTTVLGGYFGSRLMSNIREQRGLTYGINATIYNVPHDNALVIATETATQYVDEVIEQVRYELRRLQDEPIGEDELQMVKRYMEGNACRNYERNFSYPQLLMNLLATGRTIDDLNRERQLIQNATSDELLELCRRYFRPDDFYSCVVS